MSELNTLWTEKYRPKTVDEYVFKDAAQREQVESWIKAKTIPHLLFSGSAGIGKTTLAKILISALNIDSYDLLVINASRERGIDIIRDNIKNFSSTMPFGDMKIVLLDEADALTQQAQASLKGTMEEFSTTVRFILTTNHPNKIIPPIHSRCQGTHFEKIDHTEFTARVATVLVTEGVEFDLDTLDTFVKATYPDLRKCLNLLQQNSTTGALKPPSAADKSAIDYKIEMVKLFKSGKVREARTLLCSNAQVEDVEEIFRWAYDNLDIWSSTEEGQDEAIQIIRTGLVNHSLIADAEINLSACITELINIGK
jgi:replication factor C small subunit